MARNHVKFIFVTGGVVSSLGKGISASSLGMLLKAGPTLVRGGLPFRRGISLRLERPEMWIDYLEHPASFGLPEESHQ